MGAKTDCVYQLRRIGPPASQENVQDVMRLLPGCNKFGRSFLNGSDNEFYLDSAKLKNFISRQHAEIYIQEEEEKCLLVDLGLNGTYVNDFRVDGNCSLQYGDKITFGHKNGIKIKPGEYSSQPKSEFQFVFEQVEESVKSLDSPEQEALCRIEFKFHSFSDDQEDSLSRSECGDKNGSLSEEEEGEICRINDKFSETPVLSTAKDQNIINRRLVSEHVPDPGTTREGTTCVSISECDKNGSLSEEEEGEVCRINDKFSETPLLLTASDQNNRFFSKTIPISAQRSSEVQRSPEVVEISDSEDEVDGAVSTSSTVGQQTYHSLPNTVRSYRQSDSGQQSCDSDEYPLLTGFTSVNKTSPQTRAEDSGIGRELTSAIYGAEGDRSESPLIAILSQKTEPLTLNGWVGHITQVPNTQSLSSNTAKCSHSKSQYNHSAGDAGFASCSDSGEDLERRLQSHLPPPSRSTKSQRNPVQSRAKRKAKAAVGSRKGRPRMRLSAKEKAEGVFWYEVDTCAALDCQRPDERKIAWVQCDRCDQWYHTCCVGCSYDLVKSDDIEFQCGCV